MDDSERPVAFESCRYAVQSKDTPTYAEQHQGMYALLRGLAAVALLAAANDLGWVTARCAQTHPLVASAALWGTMSSLAGWAVMQRAWLWVGAAATAWLGWHNAGQRIDAIDIRMFILCGVTFVVAAMLFRASFRRFQYLFAKAVYVTYFARRRSMLASAPKGPSGGD